MTFPYRPSIHGDLRDLFGAQRMERTARNLGVSSITRGEGSLDLYETDAGPVRGMYGDLPGGGFGVAVTYRGSLRDVADIFGDQQDQLDAHASRLTAAEGRLDSAESRLNSAESRLSSAEGRLDSHASRIGATETKNTQQDNRLGALESKDSQQDGRLDSHASRLGATENATAAAAQDAAIAIGRIAKIINCINQINTSSGFASGGSFSTMAAAPEWLQLKNCINS